MAKTSLKMAIANAVASGALVGGKYHLERLLGGGAMGDVYLAHHQGLDTHVAIKLLKAEFLSDKKTLERFVREARVAARIDNPHIAKVFDSGATDSGVPYIVYELLIGEDMAAVVSREGPLPVTVAVDYIMGALEGVAAAHSHGIAHRDLKPANLFLVRKPNGASFVKVLDFGVAKALKGAEMIRGGITATSSIVGSPSYMAPEQLLDSKLIDFRADIWSMGVTLYELLTQNMPFDAENLGGLLKKILEGAPVPMNRYRRDLPSGLVAIVMRCLEKDRERRYRSARELATALAPFGTDISMGALEAIEAMAREATAPPPALSNPPADPGSNPSIPRARTPAFSDLPDLSITSSQERLSPASETLLASAEVPTLSASSESEMSTLAASAEMPTLAASSKIATLGAEEAEEGADPAQHRGLSGLINGRYTIESLTGEGGMGAVYRVADRLHPERRVALKSIRAGLANPDHLALFKSEFSALVGLQHPNLAAAYDLEPIAGDKDGHWFFTMEFIDGVDLKTAVSREPQKLLDWMVELCRALSFLHRRRLVHFDLKPQNLMVDATGRLRVLDFGLTGARSHNRILGTPAYMAPEMIEQRDDRDHRADFYSMGIVLYEMLYGELPFTSASVVGLFLQHVHDPLLFPERATVDPWLKALIEKLCAKKPEGRFANANEIIAAINQGAARNEELETSATLASQVASAGFHGREGELQALLDYSTRAFNDREQVAVGCFVSGVSGVGKSRLVRELRYKLQLDGHAFVEGHCFQGNAGEFDPIAAVLAHLVRWAVAHGHTKSLARHEAILSRLLPDYRPELTRPEIDPIAISALSARFIDDLSRQQSFAIYINDLQWAKEGTLRTLLKLAQLASEAGAEGVRRCALFISYRSDEIAKSGSAALLTQSDRFVRVDLQPLTETAVIALLGSMLGMSQPPALLVDRLMRQSAGQPLFVEELMRLLVEEELVRSSEKGWQVNDSLATVELPSRVQDVYRRRVARLDPGNKKLLAIMAALSRPVEHALLATLHGCDLGLLSESISLLKERSLVVEHRNADRLELSIVHDKLRETVYEDLGEDGRRGLHTEIARILSGAPGDFTYEIAHHARNGSDEVFALAAANAAYARAFARSDYHEVVANGLYLASKQTERRAQIDLVNSVAWGYELLDVPERGQATLERLLHEAATKEDKAIALASMARLAYMSHGDPERCNRYAREAAIALGYLPARWPWLLWLVGLLAFFAARKAGYSHIKPARFDREGATLQQALFFLGAGLLFQNKVLGPLMVIAAARKGLESGVEHTSALDLRREFTTMSLSSGAIMLAMAPVHTKDDVETFLRRGISISSTRSSRLYAECCHYIVELTATGTVANHRDVIAKTGEVIRARVALAGGYCALFQTLIEIGANTALKELTAEYLAIYGSKGDLGNFGRLARLAVSCAMGDDDTVRRLSASFVATEATTATGAQLVACDSALLVAFYGADPAMCRVPEVTEHIAMLKRIRRALPTLSRGYAAVFAELLRSDFATLCEKRETPTLARKILKTFGHQKKLPNMQPYWVMVDAMFAAIIGDRSASERAFDEIEARHVEKPGLVYIAMMLRVVVRIALSAPEGEQLAALHVAHGCAEALSIKVLRRTIVRWLPQKEAHVDALFARLTTSEAA